MCPTLLGVGTLAISELDLAFCEESSASIGDDHEMVISYEDDGDVDDEDNGDDDGDGVIID